MYFQYINSDTKRVKIHIQENTRSRQVARKFLSFIMKYLFSSYIPVIYPFSYYLSCKVDTIQTRQFFPFSHLIRYLGRFELFFFPWRIFYLSGITLLNNVSELSQSWNFPKHARRKSEKRNCSKNLLKLGVSRSMTRYGWK